MRSDHSSFRPTPREIEVLRLICDGNTTKELAGHLGISFKTAMCHRSSLLAKAGVRTAVQLYPWALQNGYLALQAEPSADASAVDPSEPVRTPEDTVYTESQLLANAEYARVQYEMFRAKIRAGSSAPLSQRGRRLTVAAKEARLIYIAASKAASHFVAES